MASTHVYGLPTDSFVLYQAGSFASSVFLAITAIEEISKVHIGSFSDGTKENNGKKGNFFYSHKIKHQLAALPTVPMGSRLNEAMGKKRVDELMRWAIEGKLVELRESALYIERKGEKLVTPICRIERELSKDLLLFAIEVFDDALVGFTNHSMDLSIKTDEMFKQLTAV